MDLGEIYNKFQSKGGFIQKLQARLKRAWWAYSSVLNGENPVIGASTHEYRKLKGFLIYCGGFFPLLLKNEFLKFAIKTTQSNRKLVILPFTAGLYTIAIPAGAFTMFLAIKGYGALRSMYFASYLATLAFFIDDPNHKIYKESKIMRNTL